MKIKEDLKEKEELWEEKDLASGDLTATPLGEVYHFGLPQSKLDVLGKIPGCHMCWINEDNAPYAELGGYRYVQKGEVKTLVINTPADSDLTDRISTVVNPPSDGLPVRAYLMCVPEERLQAAQDEMERRLRQFDQQVRRGAESYGHGYYTPKTGITYNPIPKG